MESEYEHSVDERMFTRNVDFQEPRVEVESEPIATSEYAKSEDYSTDELISDCDSDLDE